MRTETKVEKAVNGQRGQVAQLAVALGRSPRPLSATTKRCARQRTRAEGPADLDRIQI